VSESEVDFETLPAVESGHWASAEWWIARGHLGLQSNEWIISAVTVLTTMVLLVGVALVNCVLAVMTGFEDDLREKILGANAHVVVLRYGGNVMQYEDVTKQVAAIDGVEAAAPFTYTEMMIKSAWANTGIIYKGIDPVRTGAVTGVRDQLTDGYVPGKGYIALKTDEDRYAAFEALAEPLPSKLPLTVQAEVGLDPALPGIIIGKELRTQLDVGPGDKVQIINPMGGGAGPMGMPTPSVKSYRVAGVFDSGMYEYDTKWTYVNLRAAQEFLKMDRNSSTGIEARVHDPDDVRAIAADMDKQLGYPLYSRHWQDLNQKLFEALELEKWVMGTILMVLVGAGSLMIACVLIMMTLTKRREIAVLKALGASMWSISRIFVFQGLVIGTAGTVLGTILGFFGCMLLREVEYPLETDVYYLSTLPVVVEPVNMVVIAVVSFVMCMVVTVGTSMLAALADPIVGLRAQ
jgi:lipoprotein-releasing system permease protein